MRSLLKFILNIAAGFFFYMISLLSFINEPAMASGKWWIALGFSIPAFITLYGGLALNSFRNWQRSTGIVLLSSCGATIFYIFMLACLLTSSEFRLMIKPETLIFFSDYVSGGFVILCIGTLGFLMLKINNATAEQYAPTDAKMLRR